MCTVTYIPINSDSFILTHSRDENIKRPMASPPVSRKIKGIKHIFPVDLKGGGTWIAISEQGRIACLLNGGWIKHKSKPPYRHSRGKVILDYFNFSSFDSFSQNYDFDGLEPFTLIIIESGRINEIVFDGDQPHFSFPDKNKPHIYSSSTLYSPEEKQSKQDYFNDWIINNRKIGVNDIIAFHGKLKFEREIVNSISGNADILKTVSTTSIYKSGKKAEIHYYDLLNDMHLTSNLKLKNMQFEYACD